MKNLTIENFIRACGGVWRGDDAALQTELAAVTTDSRTVSPGCLFAAIPGERADGHNFIAASLEKGAVCALCQRIPDGVEGNLILVPDTIAALQAAAAFYRAQFSIPVIGITGSVGKTTAKEMTAAVLSQRFRVHKTAGNFNNDLGVPITLFGLDETHEAAVVEMGVSHPGDMVRLAEMVRPTMAMYTVIGHAHLEFLKSREGIFAEKTVMNRYLPPDGFVFCNGDDDLLSSLHCSQKKISFGMGPDCVLRAENVRLLPDGGTSCTVVIGPRRIDLRIPAYGEHMVYAALEGAAAGLVLGLSDEEIIRGVASYEPVGRRARRLRTGQLTIIDDCYNANPTSVSSAIRSLSRCVGRKVCILGDMLELGEDAAALHYQTGELARACGIDLVLTAGPLAAEIARGAGQPEHSFADRETLIEALPALLCRGDTVLVKASRSMQFEEITAALEQIRLRKHK